MDEKTKQTKEAALDALEKIIQEGFLNIGERLSSIEERIGIIEERLGEIETETKEAKMDTQDIKFHLAKKADKVEHDALKHYVEKMDKKLVQLEREV